MKQILLVSALRNVSTDNSIESMLNNVRVQKFLVTIMTQRKSLNNNGKNMQMKILLST